MQQALSNKLHGLPKCVSGGAQQQLNTIYNNQTSIEQKNYPVKFKLFIIHVERAKVFEFNEKEYFYRYFPLKKGNKILPILMCERYFESMPYFKNVTLPLNDICRLRSGFCVLRVENLMFHSSNRLCVTKKETLFKAFSYMSRWILHCDSS